MGKSEKILVTGTGRSGTSFLMHLFTELGLNTGYSKEEANKEINKYNGLRAGIEHPINSGRWLNADIVKSPEYAKISNLNLILKTNKVSHIIIPIRNLEATAKSREKCSGIVHNGYGGFWLNATTMEEQKTANAKLIYNFIEYLTSIDKPFTTISYPRMATDDKYLFEKLKSIRDIRQNIKNYHIQNYEPFKEVFDRIADVSKITVRKEDDN